MMEVGEEGIILPQCRSSRRTFCDQAAWNSRTVDPSFDSYFQVGDEKRHCLDVSSKVAIYECSYYLIYRDI